MLATLLMPLLLLSPFQEKPSATEWVDQARAYLPAYSGEHRDFLTPQQRSEVQAASHIFSAALALEPDNAYALWWKGHAQVLLAEDDLNRDFPIEGRAAISVALECFDRANRIQPDYLWSWYARGMAHERLHLICEAIQDFEQVVARADAVIARGADDTAIQEAKFLKYKARLWKADCRMQTFDFDLAREEFRAFYADNGNNRWDLGMKIAETYQRQRDFVSAVQTYESLLEVPEYAAFDGAYHSLGYLEGLLGNWEKASQRLNQALEREFLPTLYPRLWLWILAPDEQKAEALNQLQRFLAHPPGDLSPWDLELGRFLVGQIPVTDFLAAATKEVERRKTAAQPLDDLMCEVWFYAGLRQEWSGANAEALEAYKKSLAFHPKAFKWEWAYARVHFTRIACEAQEGAEPSDCDTPPYVYFFDPRVRDCYYEREDLKEFSRPGDLFLYRHGHCRLPQCPGEPQTVVSGVSGPP